jgi:hypothetical protein
MIHVDQLVTMTMQTENSNSILLQRARASGKCPPSLLSEEVAVYVDLNDGFETTLLKELDPCGGKNILRSGGDARNF